MIEMKGVAFGYRGDSELLGDVTLTLPRGSFHFLTGPSGAGKTTLLRLCIADLLPTRGQLRAFGEDVATLGRDDIALLRRELDDLSKGDSERHSERIVLQEQLEQRQLRIQRIEQDQQGDELDGARRVTLALEASRSRLRGLASQANQRLTFLATQAEAPEQTHRLSQSSVDEAAEEAAELGIPAVCIFPYTDP